MGFFNINWQMPCAGGLLMSFTVFIAIGFRTEPRPKTMRRAWFGWIVFCALAVTLGCRAPSPDWNGTWKMNPTESSYLGQIITISISTDGEYHFEEGKSSFTFRCDGKDRTIGNNRTQACVKSSVNLLELTRKENGVKTNVYRWELSADGTVLTLTGTAIHPSGPVIASQVVASRILGANDFAGEWRDTSYVLQHAGMILRLDNQALHIDYPSAGQHIDAPLDGVEAALHGAHVLEGATLAVQPAGNREFLIVTKRHGNIFTQGSLKLSNDGRIITDSWWNPDRPTDKGTLVYEKK
jgi:hypothetical protein